MFRYLFISSLLFALGKISAQRVSSVELSQERKTMVIEYLLEAEAPQEILLYFSTDGGKTFSEPLQKVSGDVGKGVTSGQKRIVWNVLEEVPELVGDNIVFMVEIAEGLIWEAKNGRPRFEWVAIPAGTFIMGRSSIELDSATYEGPQHLVTLSSFKMSKYEVTFAQYDAFCEATGRRKPSDEGWGRSNRPVINVSWNDAAAFAQWMGCRMPTEAEWEYACLAGSTNTYHTGSALNSSQANFNWTFGQTIAVGSYASNAWGLFDMHGNVWEWCSDWYGDYSSSSKVNPTGPTSGSYKVLRGGSWFHTGWGCRAAYRDYHVPYHLSFNIGFRLVVQR
jgi:formylglycine-generating enzyme required for sulfatase activity